MIIHLRSYTPATNEYEFKAHDDDGDFVAMIWVTHRDDQSDITVELQGDFVPNTPAERMEFMCIHAAAIHRAVLNAMHD